MTLDDLKLLRALEREHRAMLREMGEAPEFKSQIVKALEEIPRVDQSDELEFLERPDHYEPAMTFVEIGKALGITRQAAQLYFDNGIFKLRSQHPQACKALFALAHMRQQCFSEPTYPDWGL